MITLTAYNSNKKIYVDEKAIARVTDGHDLVGSRSYPWSEVVISTENGGEETIRVVESARLIGRLMIEAMRLTKKKNEEKGEIKGA